MAAATRADLLDTDHTIGGVTNASDVRFVIGFEETRPTRPRIELGSRSKKRQAAKATGVDAVLVIVEKHTTESRLRPVLEQHASLVLVETGGDLHTLCFARRPQVKVAHRGSSADQYPIRASRAAL